MMFLWRFINWFARALLPMRLRPTLLQQRLTGALDKSVGEMERGGAKAAKSVEKVESGETPPSKLGTFFRWFVHFLIVGLILYGLYWLNDWLRLPALLHSRLPALHPFWLPLLFLLLYLMAWMAFILWQLTGPEKVGRDFPDINQAWDDATRALADANLDLRQLPLFLVLGHPEDAEEPLFEAARLTLRVRAPKATTAPLHIHADKEAIYLTCSGASVVGRLLELLAAEKAAHATGAAAAEGEVGEELLVGAGVSFSEVQAILEGAQQQGRGPDQLTDEERRVISILVAEEETDRPRGDDKRRAFLRDANELELTRARLRHLCRLLARDRRPFCPINGVLVVLPFRATDTDTDAAQFSAGCQADLSVVREMLQVQCPLLVLTCDLHKAVGFRELLDRLPKGQRERRLGQRFPLLPDLNDSELPGMVQEGVGFLCQTLMPSVVYNLFQVETIGNGQATATVEGNLRLYHLLHELRERRQRFHRLLTRGLLLDLPDGFRFGGFYLGGTGDAEKDEQAFVSGVVEKLLKNQSYVAWTREVLAAEASYRRWSVVLLVCVAALVLGTVVFGYLAIWGV